MTWSPRGSCLLKKRKHIFTHVGSLYLLCKQSACGESKYKSKKKIDNTTKEEKMDAQKNQAPKGSSCRKKEKNDNATFLANLKDHMNEFANASIDEHKTCFKDTLNKMFGMSKAVRENKPEPKQLETHSTLPATVAE